MQQAWNPNSAGEGELGKMEMNSALMAIICRNTTWEVLVVSCFSFKLQRMWHRKGELLEDFCFRWLSIQQKKIFITFSFSQSINDCIVRIQSEAASLSFSMDDLIKILHPNECLFYLP